MTTDSRVIYGCEKCDFESEDYDVMENHKASHLGLSLEDYEKYKLMIVDTLRYRTAYENCVSDLMDFEKEHGIVRK